ncbi:MULTISPECIES: histidine phosphatase family protein [Brevibacillus]|uniref:Histidine phosphatase family protein n=1 Tax=Brevibacillus invocatus TaxID=173959 RepID=A0A3M8BZZ0_9BACL|nr:MULTISPECIES: histidine phosphatase family protein [Brevibacillus]MDH4618768.1 histidine phosphatase family protein [Brevibacillus sp. AY1]RNB69018.1 histidine phosphatase family protein [Brevibacillus invocatus]
METIMYLIRHGETDWNSSRRIQGHSDIELNELGLHQAELVAGRFKAEEFHGIYSSDLSRARVTAAQIAKHKDFEISTHIALRERCYGRLEGLTYEEIRATFTEQDEAAHGIETFEAMQERAVTALTEIANKHTNEAIVVVSHGGLINSFLHYVTGGLQGTGITKIDNTGICVFRFADRRWEVLQVNNTNHLEA